jgi:DNA mismatch repair protein MutS2
VEIAASWAFRRHPALRAALLDGWRVDMHWLLYCFLALCLSVLWDQVPYSGFGMGARFMDTVAWAHALRTAAFLVTVLPNPRRGCYARNFPPVHPTLREFLAYGFSAKRGTGCNDLVISGHGVVYAAVPLALQTFYPAPYQWPAALAWAAVAKLCLQEVVDRTHYSVDMLLAVAVTALVWAWRAPVLPQGATWRRRRAGAPADPLARGLVAAVVGIFALVLVGVAGV